MRCLWELYEGDENLPKCRLSGEEYERFLKSMQLMSGVNLSAFVEGVTIAELSLIYAAEEYAAQNGSPISVAEAAKMLKVSIPAVSRTLKSIEQKQLIRRETDEKDRRSVKLVVTEKGRDTMKKNVRSCLEVVNRVMERFSDEELSMMVNLHCKLTRALAEEADKKKKHQQPLYDKERSI